MKKLLVLFILFSFCNLQAQEYAPFKQIESYIQKQPPNRFDSSLNYFTNRLGVEIHYLYPLYQAIGWEDKLKKQLGDKLYYANFSQFLAFAGDYGKANEYASKSFESLPDSIKINIAADARQLSGIQSASAKDAIVDNAQYYRVIMINEDRAKPIHRAFTYSLLDDLYKKGYRYLAMEALNNLSNHCLDSLNVFTGFFTNEPVAGELVRKALRIGFKLVSYEDTLASAHTASQRDSIQAANIYDVIKSDPKAKILVQASYGHIAEDPVGDYYPMGYWFRKISGIDPFTVEQTEFTEGGNSEYGKIFYENFTARFSIGEPSIIFQNRRPFNPFGTKGYDILVMHPPTKYQTTGASWLSLSGERQPVSVQPTEKNLFFVQAYYSNEYQEGMTRFLIPADQTYTTNREGYYYLHLRKGSYKLVLRDVSYRILSIKELDVK